MSNEEKNLTDAQLLRLNAEKQLKGSKIGDDDSDMDVNRLIQELQVHQIELEMQNNELQSANETAETALRKYTMLYDFAPMGFFTLNSTGKIEELNFTGAEMLGERRFSLVGRNFKVFVSVDSKADFNAFLDKVYTSISKKSCHVNLKHYNNPLRSVYMEGIVNGDNGNCLLSVIGISDFKK